MSYNHIQESILDDIATERKRQDTKWGSAEPPTAYVDWNTRRRIWRALPGYK